MTGTHTTHGARDHARSLAGTVVDAMPTIPSTAATALPPGVDAADVLWDERVPGGGYTSVILPVGARLRLTDDEGDACAGIVLHRADRPTERLNVADTVKVQWQAYMGPGSLLLSGLGRVLAALLEDTSGRHDALCGTSTEAANRARYGDGRPSGPHPNGRDHLAAALIKHGLGRRDVAPNVNLFKGASVDPDGRLAFDGDPRPGTHVTVRAELPLLVTIVDVPHPLDDRPDYTVTPLRVTAWRGDPAAPHDPIRTATPEAERAYLNTEQERMR
ncbi:MAG: urea amidolyase associated protein UAAP1 [Acidimicrobiales bacterium]